MSFAVRAPANARLTRVARAVAASAFAFALLTCTASRAEASQADFCGTVQASQNNWTYVCPGSDHDRWTYVSNTYTGSGSISTLRAGMAYPGAGAGYNFYYHRGASNATFVNECYYGTFRTDHGVINQYETTGASHTIYGHVDDSENHTGCDPEYPV
jgi:hypothetical protein